MANKKQKKQVFIASLYRFGYDLMVVTETDEEATAALRKEYIRAYKSINNCNPSKHELKVAMGEINLTNAVLGEVWWD